MDLDDVPDVAVATHYRLTKIIGKGTYSSVYLARDEAGKDVAVKAIQRPTFQ